MGVMRRTGFWRLPAAAALACACWAQAAVAQTGPWRQPAGPSSPHAAAGAVRPAGPASGSQQGSQPQPRSQPPQVLSPQEQAQIDAVLRAWEQRSSVVKTFSCRFKRWEWDSVFGPKDAPKYEDLGIIKYAAPDNGLFEVQTTVRNGTEQAIEPERAEHWLCDGTSFYEYDHTKKQVIEHRLPPELRGRAIADCPLPFVFGASAASLKQRYFVRIVTPPDLRAQQTWLEAYPRFQKDAANFKVAHLILTNHTMTPYALNLYSPNGRDRTAYQFYEVVINDPLGWLKGNPFAASVPSGWQKVVDEATLPPRQATRLPPVGPH